MTSSRDALWASGHDESVEVNQRALIDKVLARYSGEFTVFRELLQNSDDAKARSVEIRFETKQYLDRKERKNGTAEVVDADTHSEAEKLPDLKTIAVHRWSFRNNGIVFRDEDWTRLKKIAEGNPDEEKIGAFGVGFYSLFSVTEEPWVTSGDQWMRFYWKNQGDQLFVRRGTLPPDQLPPSSENGHGNPWTTFEMDLREPQPIPSPFDFTRFLASSITFMNTLSDVSFYFDDKRLARLTKSPGVPKQLSLPQGLKATSDANMMHVRGIQSTPLHISAQVMRWVHTVGTDKPPPPAKQRQQAKPSAQTSGGFFSSLFSSLGVSTPQRSNTPLPPAPPLPKPKEVDLTENIDSSVVLTIFSADVEVKLDKKMTAELVRSTKKNPPSRMKYELIYTGKDEYDASKKEDDAQTQTSGSVFQGLRADLEGTGAARIFIGHATGQTTGIGGHMAARFIPTVERESIDLVDRNVAVWNRELLYVGGYLARSAYEMEMTNIRELWDAAASSIHGAPPDDELQVWLRTRALHAMRFFTFNRSTPSAEVSSYLEQAFFKCSFQVGSGGPFPLMSTVGVRNARDVRLPNNIFSGFLKQLPVLPEGWAEEGFVASLQIQKIIRAISDEDVLRELNQRPLNEEEMIGCLKWWIGEAKQNPRNPTVTRFRERLLDVAVLSMKVPGKEDEKIVPLNSIKTFINAKKLGGLLPMDGPLPPDVLPPNFGKFFNPDMLNVAFDWDELTMLDWVRHITSPTVLKGPIEYDITRSAPWSERVLNVLARAWQTLPEMQRAGITALLADKTCIPTSAGLRVPGDAYMPNVNLFPDLPVAIMPSGAPIKKELERLLIDLKVRKTVDLQMVFDRMIKTGDWTTGDLTKYLVSVQNDLSNEEMERLKHTPAFPREDQQGLEQRPKKAKARDLYEPIEIHRELGLPVLEWAGKGKWRPSSDEAKLLFKLGLRRFPPLKDVIELAASQNVGIRTKALRYFLDNHRDRYNSYDPEEFAQVSFVPATDGKNTRLGTPKEVFVGLEWSALGFLVVEPSLRNDALAKLKIREHPPTSMLVALLQNSPPKTHAVAQQWFTVLASRVTDFTPSELKRLEKMSFIPTISSGTGGAVSMRAPWECHFAGQTRADYHSQLFVFVDFGQHANSFLSACGVKHAPSIEEIAQIMLNDPTHFYKLAGGRDNYINELRNLANNVNSLTPTTLTRLKRSSVLLGSRRVKREAGKEQGQKPLGVHDLDEDDWEYEHDLLRADQIVIVDDINEHQLFGDSVFIAPQEEPLEKFYLSLGSKRLTSAVREEYKTTAEVKADKIAADIRALVLERLPLFLHEHTHARPKRPYSWFTERDHFVVRMFGKIVVAKTLMLGPNAPSRTMEASAVGKTVGASQFQLWLASNAQVDLYEVATSLNRLLFDAPKPGDALLFMTILSTDLRSLKRRGYNVDRILRQQKAEKLAVEEARRKEVSEKEQQLVSDSNRPVAGPTIPTSHSGPMGTLGEVGSSGPQDQSQAVLPVQPDGSKRNSRPQSMINSLQKWGRKLTPRPEHDHSESSDIAAPVGALRPDKSHEIVRAQSPRPGVTPLSNIAANINTAIQACRQEQGSVLHNREQMQLVKESLEEGYCDVSGRADDLVHIGDMGGIGVYASRTVPDSASLMRTKREIIARFIHVMNPLRDVYQLPQRSLHIFYDTAGDLIAFNRNASLFLNLRFYEAWHDQDVQQGRFAAAYTSWFFTLAHEIAHNLVHAHNSEHEFYFSAICEQYMGSFAKLLASTS
ncbi:hypothetical protein PUNSTDRAFT_117488 [Punctularia strigosozonata HHB-11173 SS5]|uniref:uncharacterized protein n=1 Tax=Punctularia strigosozonata (strain HHB-11173) TaxID=741275 RepID=UPI00044179A4|nr:uncharacterized protein PUNSTDRAFT_117488 [Punctularia strigosozonata HHB-11173 SS5]EIN13823.1 hypothetical protein PUNSTDRAFT_117488 [Punctularia strigosozonata HHB-11173 SS5]